jgi:hypothetical protein
MEEVVAPQPFEEREGLVVGAREEMGAVVQLDGESGGRGDVMDATA